MKAQIQKLERETREKNLILYKIDETEEFDRNLSSKVTDLVGKYCQTAERNHIDQVYRIGKMLGRRPILVRFNSSRSKSVVCKSIIESGDRNIAVANDLTSEERIQRNQLRDFVSKLKSTGIDAKIASKL